MIILSLMKFPEPAESISGDGKFYEDCSLEAIVNGRIETSAVGPCSGGTARSSGGSPRARMVFARWSWLGGICAAGRFGGVDADAMEWPEQVVRARERSSR